MHRSIIVILILSIILTCLVTLNCKGATSVSLSATKVTHDLVVLAWTRSNDTVFQEYNVLYKKTTDSSWIIYGGSGSQDSTTFNFNALANTTYSFQLKDIGDGGFALSNIITVTTEEVISIESSIALDLNDYYPCTNGQAIVNMTNPWNQQEQVTSVGLHFDWQTASTFFWNNTSSIWMNNGETVTYTIPFTIPRSVSAGSHIYSIQANFTAWHSYGNTAEIYMGPTTNIVHILDLDIFIANQERTNATSAISEMNSTVFHSVGANNMSQNATFEFNLALIYHDAKNYTSAIEEYGKAIADAEEALSIEQTYDTMQQLLIQKKVVADSKRAETYILISQLNATIFHSADAKASAQEAISQMVRGDEYYNGQDYDSAIASYANAINYSNLADSREQAFDETQAQQQSQIRLILTILSIVIIAVIALVAFIIWRKRA